ncbi:general stress protein [Paenisporosarcina sp. TG20]|uniref:general stress protein n=1 Tax=Paenisporosarcina sp. TG20 TaxID=1211706 RepID=UPI0002E0FBC9|nr:general stress protein [Paenisporosarcina sp. TG20]
MNNQSNRHIEVASTEDEMFNKLDTLLDQGYSESEIHVIAIDHSSDVNTLDRHSEVSTHEAGTFKDKFKSWFTGEDAVREGLRSLNLSEAEKDRYSNYIANGGFVLFTERNEKSLNELEDSNDPNNSLENANGFNKEEELQAQTTGIGLATRIQSEDQQFTTSSGTEFIESRFTESETTREVTKSDSLTDASKTEGYQSPEVDPNMGPAAFGLEETLEDAKDDFEKDSRNDK